MFVEKPLCLTLDELKDIVDAHAASGQTLMVGFNRRFAPQVRKMKELLALISARLEDLPETLS